MPRFEKSLDKNIVNAINMIKSLGREKIKFIMIFGSIAKGTSTVLSDIDIAIYYEGDKTERFNFRIEALGQVQNRFDIQIFQDLPIYIQKDLLSTGKIIFMTSYEETFRIFMKTIKEFELFKPIMDRYLSKIGA